MKSALLKTVFVKSIGNLANLEELSDYQLTLLTANGVIVGKLASSDDAPSILRKDIFFAEVIRECSAEYENNYSEDPLYLCPDKQFIHLYDVVINPGSQHSVKLNNLVIFTEDIIGITLNSV